MEKEINMLKPAMLVFGIAFIGNLLVSFDVQTGNFWMFVELAVLLAAAILVAKSDRLVVHKWVKILWLTLTWFFVSQGFPFFAMGFMTVFCLFGLAEVLIGSRSQGNQYLHDWAVVVGIVLAYGINYLLTLASCPDPVVSGVTLVIVLASGALPWVSEDEAYNRAVQTIFMIGAVVLVTTTWFDGWLADWMAWWFLTTLGLKVNAWLEGINKK